MKRFKKEKPLIKLSKKKILNIMYFNEQRMQNQIDTLSQTLLVKDDVIERLVNEFTKQMIRQRKKK